MQRVVLVLVVFAAACGDSRAADTGRFVVQAMSMDALAAELECGCFWSEYGFVSESACRINRGPTVPESVERCLIDAGARYQRFEAQSRCRFVAATARQECYGTRGASCDVAGLDACDDGYDGEFAACPDPCASRTGDARTECDTEHTQLQADLAACFGL